jgi:hypothetical protein
MSVPESEMGRGGREVAGRGQQTLGSRQAAGSQEAAHSRQGVVDIRQKAVVYQTLTPGGRRHLEAPSDVKRVHTNFYKSRNQIGSSDA